MRFVLIGIMLAVVTHVRAQKPKPPSSAEIRESKVYSAIADMAVRRDDLLQKFAVVMHGEAAVLGMARGPIVRPAVNVRLVDRTLKYDMSAGYTVITDQGPHFEVGCSVIQIGTKHKAIVHNPVVQPVLVKPPDTKLSRWRMKYPVAGGADPFDDYLFGAHGFDSPTHGAIEQAILGGYKLVKTETGLGGILISHWTWNPNKMLDWKITMEFDAAYEFMPTKVDVQNKAFKNDFQHTRIKWRKHGKTLLPYRIEIAYGDMTKEKESTECTYRCYWLVGDEVPDDLFKEENPLPMLLDHFNIKHSTRVNGEVIPYTHELPKDLYEDEKNRNRK